jgi:hypothetical protein
MGDSSPTRTPKVFEEQANFDRILHAREFEEYNQKMAEMKRQAKQEEANILLTNYDEKRKHQHLVDWSRNLATATAVADRVRLQALLDSAQQQHQRTTPQPWPHTPTPTTAAGGLLVPTPPGLPVPVGMEIELLHPGQQVPRRYRMQYRCVSMTMAQAEDFIRSQSSSSSLGAPPPPAVVSPPPNNNTFAVRRHPTI